ncbi:hypothetical protein GGI43DRAFT_250212 [Trichoderma evansii]
MSSLLEKVKDKLHSHSDNKTEQPEGTHGPHSSRAANAADPRVDSDRDNREALGRHDGSYTTGGDNYSYGSSNTQGMNTAGDTLTSSAKTGPAPTTAGTHKSDMLNKADPRIDSDLDGSRNMGLRSEKATHAGATGTAYETGTTGTGTTGTTGTGTTGATFGSTGPASKTAGTHKSDTMNKADPRIDSDLDGSRNMGLRSEKATHDIGTTRTAGTSGATTGTGFGTGMGTDTLGAGGGVDTSGTTGTYTGHSGLDRTSGLGSGTDTYSTGTSGVGKTSGLGSGTDTYSTGTSGVGKTSGLGSGTDTYSTGTSGTGKTSGLGSGTDTYSTDTSGMGKTSGLGSGTTGTGAQSGMDTTTSSTARIGSISTDAYGQPAQHTTKLPGDIGGDDVTTTTKHHGAGHHGAGHHGSGNVGSGNVGSGNVGGGDTTTSAYGGMGSLGGGFGTDRQATGPAANTAGPHKSDMLNKADPRVDSDLDNSKTFGGDKTYQS